MSSARSELLCAVGKTLRSSAFVLDLPRCPKAFPSWLPSKVSYLFKRRSFATVLGELSTYPQFCYRYFVQVHIGRGDHFISVRRPIHLTPPANCPKLLRTQRGDRFISLRTAYPQGYPQPGGVQRG